ncbi:MAG TPA: choice-of-anchor Q domain-containing protein, partial [Thermoanaerobaculia bacterium]|nr:choice-of-anchor Q domain-containing protein [Thermoanaerobaculia bacterium]
WPATNAGGQSELACVGGGETMFLDPLLAPLIHDAGATPTIRPRAPAVAGAAAASCLPVDQTGRARPVPCTPGAVEIP